MIRRGNYSSAVNLRSEIADFKKYVYWYIEDLSNTWQRCFLVAFLVVLILYSVKSGSALSDALK
ncbi:hypothetical protein APHNP_1329 [Anaplasma phagocytophilum str. ApNP]|uniref:Uncharacterized protein n=2 Tax=Anaplasma phagocytophilum TaxID=948 RepID=A0A0F3NHJ6_ANAPH|nr:hypothetical protein APHMUC_1495 [Anaplasma phagocytophilum str. ApMUC09]KJV66369.1 hypothetical protein APHNP_1329 [Anaplasma phagocytophilum str. ApNP]SCV65077.1 hypothetical protein ANAPH2_01151 [Anaplasma phagocytophilum]